MLDQRSQSLTRARAACEPTDEVPESAKPLRALLPPAASARDAVLAAAREDEALQALAAFLRERHGLDVGCYRDALVRRRVHNRMISVRAATLGQYLDVVQADPSEIDRLLEALTIKVSTFFRDPEAFEVVRQQLEKRLRHAAGKLRIWSAGCGNGEEAYSLALLVTELGAPADAVVLATDIDPAALARAKAGRFAERALASVAPHLKERWFQQERGPHGVSYTLVAEIRRCVELCRHDLTSSEPPRCGPFDLVCCRNTLIYFQPQEHRRAQLALRRSLAPGGFLWLGPAEWLAPPADGYEVVDRRARLFQKPGASKLS
jgi:chemotaxis methyl-accepting protein methylase